MNLNDFDLGGLVTLWHNPAIDEILRNEIEASIQLRIAGINRFSREYLFRINVIQNHAITFEFYPGTEAFKKYGSEINTSLFFSEDELQELTMNYRNGINTYGYVRAEQLAGDELSPEQKEELKNIGFLTSDIFEISHV